MVITAVESANVQFNRLTTPDSDDSCITTDLPPVPFNRVITPASDDSRTTAASCPEAGEVFARQLHLLARAARIETMLDDILAKAGCTTTEFHGVPSELDGSIYWDTAYPLMLQGIHAQKDFDEFFKRLNDISASCTARRCCWPRPKAELQWEAAVQAYLEEVNARMSQDGIHWSYHGQSKTVKLNYIRRMPSDEVITKYFADKSAAVADNGFYTPKNTYLDTLNENSVQNLLAEFQRLRTQADLIIKEPQTKSFDVEQSDSPGCKKLGVQL